MNRGVLTDGILSVAIPSDVPTAIYRDVREMDTIATITVLIVPETNPHLLQREKGPIAATAQFPSLSIWREYPSLKARTTMAIFWEG